jgi:hypothetical protein
MRVLARIAASTNSGDDVSTKLNSNRSKHESRVAALKFRQRSFQRFAVGMIGSCVIKPFILTELFLHVGGSLIDGKYDGPGGRIRLLPDVNGICGETHNHLL